MSKTVFILGAGASRLAGGPLMNDFLDVAEDIKRSGMVGEAVDSFDLVFEAIHQLAPVHAKATIDRNNLESVFAAFEMARLLGSLGELKPSQVRRLPLAMAQVIERTLVNSIKFPVKNNLVASTLPYQFLREKIQEICSSQHGRCSYERVSIITFNYDLCMDKALAEVGIRTDYRLGGQDLPDSMKLLKLHGSLNWGRCSKCRHIVPLHLGRHMSQMICHCAPREAKIDPSTVMRGFAHCKGGRVTGPEIVPPTWSKGHYHQRLEPVWQAAASELRDAEDIIVIGYSLPNTDQFFHYLYALGTVGRARLRRLVLVDPNADGEVKTRFERLLGPDALYRFQPIPQSFEKWVKDGLTELAADIRRSQ